MVRAQVTYNPYTVETTILINGNKIGKNSQLRYVEGKRLQQWMEPSGGMGWKGIFPALREETGDDEIEIGFVGTEMDFEDLEYAKELYGKCFRNVSLTHENRDSAKNIDPMAKWSELRKLYDELQKCNIEEFKTEDIKQNFEKALNSDFSIVVVAPMSSGKSTLLNALMGRDLLPAVNQAATAVITDIRDNDDIEDFLVTARDESGNVIDNIENLKATKELISELNYKIDPSDAEGKRALVSKICLEGPIPNIPSEMLHTVFRDTPGGNNAQNAEHEKLMEDAINDENKNMILYVFDGDVSSTNDGKGILDKIANAMKNSRNGKQSRDRFFFVANKMDDYDTEKEPFRGYVENTVLPMLESQGIKDPNLFLVSSLTAKLIRMQRRGETFTRKEKQNLGKLTETFSEYEGYALTEYATINKLAKEKMLADAAAYAAEAEESDEKRYLAAELNCGIPALEYAISEYLCKYAMAIKIKTLHDSFMKKVHEKNMIDNFDLKITQSRDALDEVRKELEEKQSRYEGEKKLEEFKKIVDGIKIDFGSVEKAREEVSADILAISLNCPEKIKKESAGYELEKISRKIVSIGRRASNDLDIAFNNGILKTCRELVNEFEEYLMQLDDDGIFNIGSFELKKLSGFERLDVEDLLEQEEYQTSERVKVGEKTVKQRGFFSWVKRIFGAGGYETEYIYETQDFVRLRELVENKVTDIQDTFDDALDEKKAEVTKAVEGLKSITKKRLEAIHEIVIASFLEIERKIKNIKSLETEVEKNRENAEWIKNFVSKVDELMAI